MVRENFINYRNNTKNPKKKVSNTQSTAFQKTPLILNRPHFSLFFSPRIKENETNSHSYIHLSRKSGMLELIFLSYYQFICSLFNNIISSWYSWYRITASKNRRKNNELERHLPRDWEKPWKTSIRIAFVRAEMRTLDLPTTKQGC